MARKKSPAGWLLFLAQVPASPSSVRVALWRRLRAAGAVSVINGAWVLPHSEEHVSMLAQLVDTARKHGGNAVVFTTNALDSAEREIVAKFRADRAGEYREFRQRARLYLAEAQRETERRKFTFAELEELEDDLAKLATWLAKIRERDFFPAGDGKKADAALTACQTAFQAFSREVYRRDAKSVSAERGDGR